MIWGALTASSSWFQSPSQCFCAWHSVQCLQLTFQLCFLRPCPRGASALLDEPVATIFLSDSLFSFLTFETEKGPGFIPLAPLEERGLVIVKSSVGGRPHNLFSKRRQFCEWNGGEWELLVIMLRKQEWMGLCSSPSTLSSLTCLVTFSGLLWPPHLYLWLSDSLATWMPLTVCILCCLCPFRVTSQISVLGDCESIIRAALSEEVSFPSSSGHLGRLSTYFLFPSLSLSPAHQGVYLNTTIWNCSII